MVVETEGNTYVTWFCFLYVEFFSLNSHFIFVFILIIIILLYPLFRAIWTILFISLCFLCHDKEV